MLPARLILRLLPAIALLAFLLPTAGPATALDNTGDAGLTGTAEPASPSGIQRTMEQRIGGADRYEVAANVSRWLPESDGALVLVASGEVFTDALSASPLAAHEGGRLLLTSGKSLPPSVVAELTRSRPSEIVITGGPGTVSNAVQTALSAYAPVTRIGGADRYAVAAGIATRIPSKHVVIASGELFSDALSAGPLAAKLGGPLLLVRSGELPAATAEALRAMAPESVTVLGGPATVGKAVLDEIVSITGAHTTRVGGADRYEVAANVAKQFFSTADTAVFASGVLFPDGLSGTPLAHSYDAPILLSASTCNPSHTLEAVRSLDVGFKFFVGGASSVTSSGFQCGASTVLPAINPPAVTTIASTVPLGSPDEEAFYFVPHQDDELISMVGGIVRDINLGRRVHVYVMHTGFWTGVKQIMCDTEKICLTDDQLSAARNAEILTSLERLGVPSACVHFLHVSENDPEAGAYARHAVDDVMATAGPYSHFRTISWLDAHPNHYLLGHALRRTCAAAPAETDCLWFQSTVYQTRPEALRFNPVGTPRGEVITAASWQVSWAAAAYRENDPARGRYGIGWRSVSSQIAWIEKYRYSWAHGVEWPSASARAAAEQWMKKYQPGIDPNGKSSITTVPFEEQF